MYNSNSIAAINNDYLEWGKIREALQETATTSMAKAIISSITPARQVAEARLHLQQTAELFELLKADKLHCNFSDILDCLPLLNKTDKGGFLSKEDLHIVLVTVRGAQTVHGIISELLEEKSSLMPILKNYRNIDEVIVMLDEIIDHRGEIRDSASPELLEARLQIRTLNDAIHQKLKSFLEQHFAEEYFQDDYITVREDRLVLPLKANMKGKFKGIIHGSSNTGQTYFIEPEEVVQSNNEFKLACQAEQIEIEKILRNVSRVLQDYKNDIAANIQVATELDVLCAKARISRRLNGALPQLVESYDDLLLLQARHPLMCLMNKNIVSNDLTLSKDKICLLISGPNAGGKTVALKTFGLNALLATVGILPAVAANSKIPVCDQIFVDIGDQQSIEEGLSTFSAHLKTLAAIFEQATSSSLVLLDEVVSGTNAEEGAALAQAILEELVARNIKTLVSTHYQNLKKLPAENPKFVNASMEIHPKTNRPTYKLIYGVAGNSNAIALAKESGLQKRLIDRAVSLLGPGRQLQESFEEEMRQQRLLLAEKNKELDERIRQLQKQEAHLQKQLAALEAENLSELLVDYDKFKRELAEARRRLREIAPTLQPAKVVTVQKNLDHNAAIAEEVAAVLQKSPDFDQDDRRELKVGDEVTLRESAQPAKVISAANHHGIVEVSMGMMRMKVHRDELVYKKPLSVPKRPYDRPSGRKNRPNAADIPYTPQADDNTLDLRGRSVDEAVPQLVAFLDRAILNSTECLVIIHGHGSNKIKNSVRDYLQSSPYNVAFRAGNDGEGGNGVTIVQLY